MTSWKRRSRANRKRQYTLWKQSDSDTEHYSRWAVRRWGKKGIHAWEGWGHRQWRKQYALRWKRDIRKVNEGMKQFSLYPYFEDCRYHPCKVTKLEPDPDWGRLDVEGESLINGTPSSCSYFHCGIVHLTKEEGEERAAFANEYGMLPYELTYILGTTDDMVTGIRSLLKREADWNFSSNAKVDFITDAGKAWMLEKYSIVFDELTPITQEELDSRLA